MVRHDTRFPTGILIILERDDETKEKQSSQYSGQGVLFLQKIIVAFIHKSQLTGVVAHAWFRGEAAPSLPTPFAKQLQTATVWLHAPTPTGRNGRIRHQTAPRAKFQARQRQALPSQTHASRRGLHSTSSFQPSSSKKAAKRSVERTLVSSKSWFLTLRS